MIIEKPAILAGFSFLQYLWENKYKKLIIILWQEEEKRKVFLTKRLKNQK